MDHRTERLYWKDPFLGRFEATVRAVLPVRRGEANGPRRAGLVLNRTAFYPEGGGQPCDLGTLSGLAVVDVREGAEGPVHTVELPDPASGPPPPGSRVEGVIDSERRFDHMQQHTGQHLLTRAFIDAASSPTRSFHLGTVSCTIDIEMSPPDGTLIQAAVDRANRIIWDDVPVRAIESSPAPRASGAEPGRPAGPKVPPGEAVRTIQVDGFDATPCGGTHVARTGQVGLVAVTGWEPVKGLTRITFVCGGRVGARLREAGAVLGACVSALSAPPDQVSGAVESLLREKESLHRQLRHLGGRLAEAEAAAAAATSPEIAGIRVLSRIVNAEETGLDLAKEIVKRFVRPSGRLALLAVVDGETATVIAGRSRGEKPPVGPVIAEAARAAGGRGGGSPEMARAGGIPAESIPALLENAARILAPGDGDGRG